MRNYLYGMSVLMLSVISIAYSQNQEVGGFLQNSHVQIDSQTENLKHSEAIEWIMERALQAVLLVESNRVYLNPNRLILTDEGVALLGDDNTASLPLPTLYSGIDGPFVQLNIFGTWRCGNCGYINSRFVNTCQNCYTPREE